MSNLFWEESHYNCTGNIRTHSTDLRATTVGHKINEMTKEHLDFIRHSGECETLDENERAIAYKESMKRLEKYKNRIRR